MSANSSAFLADWADKLPRDAMARTARLARRPETIVCGALLLIAVVVLEASGYASVAMLGMMNIAALAIFAFLTDLRSKPQQGASALSSSQRSTRFRTTILWVQIVLMVVFIVLSAHDLLLIVGLAPITSAYIPYWTKLEFAFGPIPAGSTFIYGSTLIYGSYQVAPTLLIALAVILFFLGGRPREMGITAGNHSWRQAWLWSFAPLVLFLTGRLLASPQLAFSRLVTNLFIIAPVQEWLFRGALMTRLTRAFSSGWGLTVSSCAFGLWHIGLVSASVGTTNLLIAGAAALVTYGVLGLATGILFLRTHNLLAPTILHGIVASAFF